MGALAAPPGLMGGDGGLCPAALACQHQPGAVEEGGPGLPACGRLRAAAARGVRTVLAAMAGAGCLLSESGDRPGSSEAPARPGSPPFGNRAWGLVGIVRTVPDGRRCVACPFLRPWPPQRGSGQPASPVESECRCEGNKKAFKFGAYVVKHKLTLLYPSPVRMINSLPSVWLLRCLAQRFDQGCR